MNPVKNIEVFSITYRPRVIIILSGKRKSGKDYVTDKLVHRLSNLVDFCPRAEHNSGDGDNLATLAQTKSATSSSSSKAIPSMASNNNNPIVSDCIQSVPGGGDCSCKGDNVATLDHCAALAGKDIAMPSASSRKVAIVQLSGPLKAEYARTHGLDLAALLSDSAYKEAYRRAMVEWSEALRAEDPGYFARIAVKDAMADRVPIWIVSDARRQSDLAWFERQFGTHASAVLTVRVTSSDVTRSCRGWVFTPGIDDAETECGLDGNDLWDFLLVNDDGGRQQFEDGLCRIVSRVAGLLK